MLPREHESKTRSFLLATAWAAGAALVAWFLLAYALGWHRGVRSIEDWRIRVGLSVLGVAVTASVGRWLLYCGRAFPRAAWVGTAGLLTSAVCYYLLVWTSLKIHPALWRVWWVSLVATLAAVHAMALRLPATGRRGRIEQFAAAGIVVLAVLLGLLAFQHNVLDTPHPIILWAMGLFAVVVTAGSIAARVRFARSRPRRPMPRWKRLAWVSAGFAGVFVAGLYVGRITAPRAETWEQVRSPLATLSPAEVDQQVRLDLRRLDSLSAALDDLRAGAASLHIEFVVARRRDGRNFYTPAEAERLRPQYMSFLACRDALLRIVATYASFREVRDVDTRARCFLAAFGAGSACYASSLELVRYGDDPAVRRKLNEAEPAWDLPAGRFDEIRRSVASDHTATTFAEMAAYFESHKDGWRTRQVLPLHELEPLVARIDADLARVRRLDIDRGATNLELLVARVKADSYDPLYQMQGTISTWIGDTRLVARPSFISPEKIRSIQSRLRPGDILLERRNWFASNAFLPGFWPHAALYLGTPEQLAEIGLLRRTDVGNWTSDDPTVADKLPDYLAPAHDGQPHTVMESVSEGVIFNSLTESMAADYVAVLRPRNLSPEQIAAALRRAFAHEGKPYDFEFDFASSDKLVCTELVYQCYQGMLGFDCDPVRPGEQLPEIMGRRALPAMEFCKKFARERDSDARELEFVLFLDAVPALRYAREANVEEFVASGDRPKGFNE